MDKLLFFKQIVTHQTIFFLLNFFALNILILHLIQQCCIKIYQSTSEYTFFFFGAKYTVLQKKKKLLKNLPLSLFSLCLFGTQVC